jgi:hypothetical protein
MKTYGEVDVYIHVYFTWIAGWVGPRFGLDDMEM